MTADTGIPETKSDGASLIAVSSTDREEEESPKPRPAPTEHEWDLLRAAYKKVKKDTDKHDVALYRLLDAKDHGFQVPYEVRNSPGKGRGLFLTSFVRKGTVAYQDRSGKFYTEEQWREFLTSLPHALAQDCCEWAYVEEFEGQYVVYLDLCEGSLMNHGDNPGRAWRNFICSCGTKKGESANLKEKLVRGVWCAVASRDLDAGEEMLMDYTDFHDYDEPLKWFDNIWSEYHPDADSDASDY